MPLGTARRCRRAQPRRSWHGPDCRLHSCGLPGPARHPGTPHRPRARQHLGRLLLHLSDPEDAARLAASAKTRLLYRYAIPLYRYAADADRDRTPPIHWPSCWPRRGDLAGAAQPAVYPGGYGEYVARLADLLADRGDLDGAERSCAGRRRRRVCRRPAGQAAGRARRPGRAARPGPTPATWTPPNSWPGCWPSAATWTGCAARADAGDGSAAIRLADLLAERGDLDKAEDLRARADAGDGVRRLGWPICWPSAATWTGPSRYSAPLA